MEENWVEVTDFWTRGELRRYTEQSGEDFVTLWRRKVTACHVVTGDLVIDDPLQVHDQLDDLDIRLMRFLTGAVTEATSYLLSLGEANKRLSFAGAGAAVKKTQTTQTTPALN
jgi:hypothetical protein